jgi:rRNA-processing protein FCF1
MQIVVNDTNIFIDLIHTELIDLFFQLPFEVHTTDFVIGEIEEEEQERIVQKLIDDEKLFVAGLNHGELEEIMILQNEIIQLSIPDCSVWLYSKKNNYTLITGDGLLRKTAIKDGVEVKGVLFVLDELIRLNLMDSELAAEKLELLLQIGSRLPKNECEERLVRWRS